MGPLSTSKIDKSDFKLLCDSFHVEKINIKLCKYVLGVSRCATNAAVMGELGRFPIAIRIVKHAFNYWKRICNLSENSVVKVSYTDSITTDRCAPVEKNWAACVKGVLLNFDGQLQWEQQRCSPSAHDLDSAMCNKYESSWLDLINKNVNNMVKKRGIKRRHIHITQHRGSTLPAWAGGGCVGWGWVGWGGWCGWGGGVGGCGVCVWVVGGGGGGYLVRFRIGMLITARRLKTLQWSKRGVETVHFPQ